MSAAQSTNVPARSKPADPGATNYQSKEDAR
jgi:hypothetical protein